MTTKLATSGGASVRQQSAWYARIFRSKKLPIWLELFLLIKLSLLSSGVGIVTWFATQISLWQAVITAGVVTTMLSLGIIIFWGAALDRQNSVKVRTIFTVAGSVLSSISALLAMGCWLHIMAASDLAQFIHLGQSQAIMVPAAEIQKRFEVFAGSMDRTALLTRDKARQEVSRGTSCDGKKLVVRKRGRRHRMRKHQQQQATRFASQARAMATGAIIILARFRKKLTQTEVNKAYAELRRLKADPRLSAMRHFVETNLTAFRTQFYDPKTGARFICGDRASVRQLLDLKRQLDALSAVKTGTPPTIEILDFGDAIKLSYAIAFKVFGQMVTGQSDPKFAKLFGQAKLALGMAGGIELFILLLLWRLRELDDPDTTELPPAERDPRVIEHYTRWAPLLLNLRYEHRQQAYFVVPLNGDAAIVADCQDLVLRRKWKPAPDLPGSVSLDELDPDWVESRAVFTGGATKYRFYPLGRGDLDWIRNLLRDVAGA